MKNKLEVLGYAFLIVIAFYTVIYAVTPNRVYMNIDYKALEEYSSGELDTDSGDNISGDFFESGDMIATMSEFVTNGEIKGEVKGNKKLKSNSPYYIKVNNSQNVVTIYKKDANGEYTVPYKAMVCSTGSATPDAGKSYKTTTYKKRWNGLQGNVYGQYATQIIGNILFHSVPYTSKSNDTLEYWEYDKLGSAASLGCIRLTVADAKWIYDNIPTGTIVEFYEDSDPGPLGKPTAQIISNNERCRNWDPTDPAEGNPWNSTEIQEVFFENNIENHEITYSGEESISTIF